MAGDFSFMSETSTLRDAIFTHLLKIRRGITLETLVLSQKYRIFVTFFFKGDSPLVGTHHGASVCISISENQKHTQPQTVRTRADAPWCVPTATPFPRFNKFIPNVTVPNHRIHRRVSITSDGFSFGPWTVFSSPE
jgi:hypothetical protein